MLIRELPVVGVAPEDLDQLLACPVQPALDAPKRRVRYLGDLLVAEALQVSQHEDRAVRGPKLLELGREPGAALGVLERARWILLRRRLVPLPLFLVGRVHRRRLAPRRDVQGAVVRDAQEPRAERLAAERV